MIDRLLDEIAPFIEATPSGGDAFAGFSTKRTGALVARSETARELDADDSNTASFTL